MFGNTITPKEAVGRHSLDDSPCTYTSGNIGLGLELGLGLGLGLTYRREEDFFLSNFFSDYCHCLYLRL